MLFIVLFTVAGILLGVLSNALVQRLARQMFDDANEFAWEQLGLPTSTGTPKTLPTAPASKWHKYVLPALGAAVGLTVGAVFGATWQGGALFAAGFLLLWLSAVDLKTMYLPETLNYALGGIGILAGALGWFVAPEKALMGILVGYLILYIPAIIFHRVRGVAGVGEGDCLLLAAIGAYIGPMAVIPVLLLASLLIIGRYVACGGKRDEPMPFGPALALAGVLTFALIRMPSLQPGMLQMYFQ